MAELKKTAAAVVKHRGVEVRIYGPLPDRRQPVWLLTRHNGSRRDKKTVKGTLDEARREAKPFAEQVASGDAALRLTPLQNRIYLTAQDAAARIGRPVDVIVRESVEATIALGAGASLMDAVRFYRTHHASDLPAATPAQVIAELMDWLAGKRRSLTTIKTLRSIYAAFARDFTVPISHILSDDLDRWITSHAGHAPRTQRNYRSALVRLFNFAKGRYLSLDRKSAAQRLQSISDDNRGAISIFRPWELERLLSLAPDSLRPCIALGAFAGLRTIELTRIEWSAIRFADELAEEAGKPVGTAFPHGFVEVAKSAAKQHRTAARRLIPIQANLAAWLAPYRFRAGPVSPYRRDADLSEAITALVQRINVREKKAHRPLLSRPKNGLRHSYGSYRLPIIESVAALALEMNNSPAEIIRDYRELVYPRDVEAYWKIAPAEPAQIIQSELFG